MNHNDSTAAPLHRRQLYGLEKMGVLLGLAASIFYAKAMLNREDEQHFEAQPRHVRHHFLELAIGVTKIPSYLPLPAAVTTPSTGEHAGPQRCVEVGEGGTRPVDPLFDLAAGLARGRVLAFGDSTPRPSDCRD